MPRKPNGVKPFPVEADAKQEFLRMIAEGATWRVCARALKISQATFSKWLSDDPLLEKQYARALEAQGDDFAWKVIETAEDPTLDPNEKRVRIDAYKWAAGKRRPKVYGDRHEVTHISGVRVEVLTDDELHRIASGGGPRASSPEEDTREPH